ncbi:MAG: hypothetical protein ACYSUC_13200 [Planctomycetota bacterium]|jgi:hypothetical protein
MPSYAIKSSGIRQVAANSLIGNSTGSTGSAEELSSTDAKTLLGLGTSDSPTFAGLTIDEDSSYSIGVSKIAYKSGGSGTKARISVSNVTELELTGSKLAVGSGHSIGFASTSYADSGFLDTVLYRDGAGVIAQRNGTNAQIFRIYNTDDGSQTNYGRASIGWANNVFAIDVEASGTGTQATLQIKRGGQNRISLPSNSSVTIHTSLYPSSNGSIYNGWSSLRWANVYSVKSDISQLLTVGGDVSMPNLPTSDPASAGLLWNDSGTLKISAG